MKRIWPIFLAVLLLLSGCAAQRRGSTDNTQFTCWDYGDYSQAEVSAAADAIKAEFRNNDLYLNTGLDALWFDGSLSDRLADRYRTDTGSDAADILVFDSLLQPMGTGPVSWSYSVEYPDQWLWYVAREGDAFTVVAHGQNDTGVNYSRFGF